MELENPLGREKVWRLLIEFSLPAIIGTLVNAMYTVIDRIFIGNSPDLGANGLAGITIGFPIVILIVSVAFLFGVGGATLFSIKLGEGDKDMAARVLGNSFLLLILSGVVITLIGEIFLEPILNVFGATKEVLPYSMEFMRIIFLGSVFQIVSLGLNYFMRADGKPSLAMVTMLISAGTNIVLDAVFINIFKMGMTGAALGTVIAQIVATVWIASYFFSKKANTRMLLKNIRVEKIILTKVISLGMPGFLMQLVGSLLNVILNKSLMIYGGELAVSGMGIVNSIQTILLMPVVGLNQGVQPIVSFNFGAKKFNRVKEAEKIALSVATVIVVIGFICIRLYSKEIVELFNKNPELVKFTSHALLAWFMFLPVIGVQIIAANYFQAVGKFKIAAFLTLTRQLIILIPLILIFSRAWGLNGILYSSPTSDITSACLTIILFLFNITKLGKKEKGTSISQHGKYAR